MSVNSRQYNQNVQEVSVKLEPREFCTESTEKVSKFQVEVGSGGSEFPVGQQNGVSLTKLEKQSHESVNTAQTSPAPVAVVNNDACKLIDFCTNIRVKANLGLKEGLASDTDSRDSSSNSMSDETEYESAEQMAQAGAPVPSTAKPVLGVPKTPGAKWSRHTYVSYGSGPPIPVQKTQFLEKCEPGKTLRASKTTDTVPSQASDKETEDMTQPQTDINNLENCPLKFIKILPKQQPSDKETEAKQTDINNLENSPLKFKKILPKQQPSASPSNGIDSAKSVAAPAALQLVNFCTNIKVEGSGTMTSEASTTESTVLNSTPGVPTCQSNGSVLIAAKPSSSLLASLPSLLNSSSPNIISLPRPPNKFQYHWMNVYHWLEYDTEKHAMFCNMCKKLKKVNPFAAERGCTNFKTCTLKRHEESKEHKEAILHYATSNQATVVDRQSVAPKQSCQAAVGRGPGNRILGDVSHFRLGGGSTQNVTDQKGQKRDAHGKVIVSNPLTGNNVQMGDISGVQFKIIPQTITTANSGGAPVMIHKLVRTNQAAPAANLSQQQPRNYNGFRMMYHVAKEQLPSKSVDNIISLVNYPPYHNWKEPVQEMMLNDLLRCIATTLWKAIEFQLSRVNFISLTLEDGGEDVRGGFHWILVSVKYVYQKKICTYFVHLDKLHEMSVEELMLVMVEWMLKNRIPFHKLVGLEVGADKDGLITHLLPQVIHKLSRQGCKLVSVHTTGSPQVSVAVSEVSQHIPALQRYNDFVGMLFDYIDSATNRIIEIPLLQEHLNEQAEDVMNYSSMMWLSRASTIKVIYLVWAALVEALQAEDDEEAHDLLKIIKQYTFIALTHFFMDFLPSIHALDEIVRKEPWNSSAISSAADYAIASVEALQDHLGAHEQQFFAHFDEASGCFSSVPLLNHQAQQQEVADVRNEFLQIFLIELQGRYPRGFDSRAKDAFHVLHPKVLREIKAKGIKSLGLPQMLVISQALGIMRNGAEAFQWIFDHAVAHPACESITEFCQKLLGLHCTVAVAKMIECLSTLPGHHVKSPSDRNKALDCLKGILKLELGKGVARDKQVISRLCIMMNGPPIDKFNFETAYMQWLKLHPGQMHSHSKLK